MFKLSMYKTARILLLGAFFILFSYQNVHSQATDEQIDKTLVAVVKYFNTSGNDSIYYQKIDSLENLLNDYIENNPISERYLVAIGKYAKEIAPKDYSKAIRLLKENIEQCETLNYNHALSLSMHNLGSIYADNKENHKAIEIFIQTVKMFKDLEDWPAYAYCLIDIGNIYYRGEFYDRSIDYYNQALIVFREHFNEKGYNAGASVCFQNIGIVNEGKGDYELALEFYKKSLNSRIASEQINNLSYAYSYIAGVYFKLQLFDSTECYLLKSVHIDKEINITDKLLASYRRLGDFKQKQGYNEESLIYYLECYRISKQAKNNFQLVISEHDLGKVFYSLNKLDSAILFFKSSYQKSIEIEFIEYTESSAEYLVMIYENTGEYESAIPYYQKLLEIKDYKIQNSIVRTALQFEIKERKEERQLFENENKRHKEISLTMIAIIALIIIVLILLLSSKKKIKNQSIQIEKSLCDLQIANTHLNRTYSIIAHDLKGPIGSSIELINNLNIKDLDSKGREYYFSAIKNTLNNSYDLMISLLAWSRVQEGKFPYSPSNIDLRQILDNSLNLVSEIANKKTITISNSLNKKCIIYADINMTTTIVNNLLVNAIKYTNNGGEIKLSTKVNGDYCSFTVEDDGVGMSKQQLNDLFKRDKYDIRRGTNDEKGSGLGLKLVYEFVKLNKGNIQVISEEGNGSRFVVDFMSVKE